MKDTTFWPRENIDMKERMADMCMLDLAGSGKAIGAPEANISSDMTDFLGGGEVYGSPEAFMTLLPAVPDNDSRLLQAHSYDELFEVAVGQALKIMTPKSPALRPAEARIRWSDYSNFRAEELEFCWHPINRRVFELDEEKRLTLGWSAKHCMGKSKRDDGLQA